MPLRRLLVPPKIDVVDQWASGCGEVVSMTISEDPPQFSHKAWRPSEDCPVCGTTTIGAWRLPATLHPKFANGFGLGFGVWVHPHCLECCPDTGEPTPVPW